MNPASQIDAIASAADIKAVEAIFQNTSGEPGFSATYFARVLAAFGHDPAAASKLAGYWRLLLRHGDDPALAYRTKGAFDRLEGRWLDSAKAFIKSGSLAGEERDRLSYQVGAVDSLARAGRTAEAVALGSKLARGLDNLGERGLAGRVRLNVGNALLWVDRYRDSIVWLREAASELEGIEAVYAKLGLSTAELYGGSPLEAHRFAVEAREAAGNADYTAALCDLNIAQSALMQGRADEALQVLLQVRPAFEASPHDQARVSGFLGDTYLQLNLWPEAIDAYEEALSRRRVLPALNVGTTLLGLGQAQIASETFDLAIDPLRKASAIFRKGGNLPWAASADTWLAKAVHKGGRISQAQNLASAAAGQARKSRSAWHEAEALLTAAECGSGGLRRAARLIEANGYLSMRWRVPALKSLAAPSLPAHRRTFEAILENRMLTSSPVSRSAYLRDKGAHISAFLAELLSKPTPRRVEEAIDVVARSRSAALLDEMLSGSGATLSAEQLRQLDGLRAELQSLEAEGHQPGGARRIGASPERIAALQRRWIEATHRLLENSYRPSDGARTTATILARAGDDLYAMRDGWAKKLRIGGTELEQRLRWMRFELLAPMADRSADPVAALGLIGDLGCSLIAPWIDKAPQPFAICPEGQLWQVPWTTCLSSIGVDVEPVLSLHPTLTKVADLKVQASSRAMIWIYRSQDLYHAGVEERSFLESFPNALVCRSAAEARESLKEQVDFLHVICHARHNAANPMFSSLQFGDGALYAAEIARSGFRSEVVSLSACETGNVRVALRDEPDGLARAFLARGAKTVIGSLWPLDDEAAAKIYTTLFEQLLRGVALIDALKYARRSVQDWNSHPYFWGSLVLFGGYG